MTISRSMRLRAAFFAALFAAALAVTVLAQGGSAGGLLMGAVVNLRPDLFNGVIAAVPFVDVVTTMLDPSIPLTTSEYDEWGNPNDPAKWLAGIKD